LKILLRAKTPTPNQQIKTKEGGELTLSSPDLSEADLAVAEVLLEMAAEQGSAEISFDEEELARRLRAKGYDPMTGQRSH
jgi:hypothetical protein